MGFLPVLFLPGRGGGFGRKSLPPNFSAEGENGQGAGAPRACGLLSWGDHMIEQARRLLADFLFIGTREYLALFPESGCVHTGQAFDIPYYVVRNCLCAGELGQIVMPPGSRGGRAFILRESFNHEHSEELLAQVVSSALLHADRSEPAVLDEAVPLYPLWSLGNLWHWLFESVPKIFLMESAGYKGQYVANASSKVVLEGLELMGVGPERIVHCAGPHLIRRAVIPHVIHWSGLHEHKRLLSTIRERLLEAAGALDGEKRCFIRRIGTRRLLNEAELLETLRSYDIEVLVPEEHSLRGQIAFMSNAALTLSPHGANSALAFFQKRESILMEFFGHDHVNNGCNLIIIKLLKLLYFPVTQAVLSGQPVGAGASGAGLDDYRIDVDLVASILGNIASTTYRL